MSERASQRVRRALRTVRVRATLAAVALMAGALALALFAILGVYRGQLTNGLDQTLRQQVIDRARLLDDGSSAESLTTVLQEEALVWIGTADGQSIAMGGALIPLENPVPATLGVALDIDLRVEEIKPDEVAVEIEQLRVATAQAADGTIVLAGAERDVIDNNLSRLAAIFASFLPIMVALIGVVTWFVAGRVLRPVESMRSEAAAISGANLDARVPVPDTDDEVHGLALTLNSMLDRLESHDRSMRQFSADASHELKSPVANVRAMVDTAELDDPEWPTLRAQLGAETDRLRELVDNLLWLATNDEVGSGGEHSSKLDAVSLDDLLFDEAEMLASTTSLDIDLSRVEPTIITGSRSDLTRLVRNLVDNAVRHAGERIELSVGERADGQVMLAVGDDGPGIAAVDRERIFDRFTRLDEARARDDGGAGLGLAIVTRIAAAHGAEVVVDDREGGGSIFRVAFDAEVR